MNEKPGHRHTRAVVGSDGLLPVPSDADVALVRPDGGYLVSQALGGGPVFEQRVTRYRGIFVLRTGPDQELTVLMPGSLAQDDLTAALRRELLAEMGNAAGPGDEQALGDFARIGLICLQRVLGLEVPGGS
jgi:hypothetical protein